MASKNITITIPEISALFEDDENLCPQCDGNGKLRNNTNTENGYRFGKIVCDRCGGTGLARKGEIMDLRERVEKIASKIDMQKVVEKVVFILDGDVDDECYIRSAVAMYTLQCIADLIENSTEECIRVAIDGNSFLFDFALFLAKMENNCGGKE